MVILRMKSVAGVETAMSAAKEFLEQTEKERFFLENARQPSQDCGVHRRTAVYASTDPETSILLLFYCSLPSRTNTI